MDPNPIIPGLIDDLGQDCLIRIPFHSFPTALSVSKTWSTQITHPDFLRFRKLSGLTRPVFILAQSNSNGPNLSSGHGSKDTPSNPVYKLTVSDPGSGFWADLPELPELPELPVFAGVVGSGSDLVVIGGLDPVTLRATSSVFVYSFISGTWRKGKDMPGVRRSFFGCCGSHSDRTVVVAGGHDEDKNALKSALLYDVERDEWVPLPDMERERDECKVVCLRGRFHVISGYPTESQGVFDTSAEVFDPVKWSWETVVEDFLEASADPRSCVAGPDSRVHACVGPAGGDVAVHVGDRWQAIAKVPTDVRILKWVSLCGNKMVIFGSSKFGEPINGYELNLKDNKWSKIDIPQEYCGHIQSGCILEL